MKLPKEVEEAMDDLRTQVFAGYIAADAVLAHFSSLETELEKTRENNCELYVENAELKQNAIHARNSLEKMEAALCMVRFHIKRRAFQRAEREIDAALKVYRSKGDEE